MNVLVIGQNTKIANVFNVMNDRVYMVVDYIPNYRSYRENNLYRTISTSTNILRMNSIPKRIIEIRKWCKDFHIDIIFTNEKNSMIAAKLATLSMKKRIIHLSTSHNSYAFQRERNVRFFSYLVKLCTDGYLALASFVYNKLVAHGVSEKKILLFPNTIEDNLFFPKKSYAISGDYIKVAYTAVVAPGKAQDVLLRAVSILKQRGIDIKVDFYGNVVSVGTQYSMELADSVSKLGLSDRVCFKGLIENDALRVELANYDLYVCPSRMEMSPFNILEAKATGLPIIATNVGGIPDLIEDGVDGLLVPVDSPESIADAIERCAKDENYRRKLGKGALFAVSQNKSVKKASEALSCFIKSIGR